MPSTSCSGMPSRKAPSGEALPCRCGLALAADRQRRVDQAVESVVGEGADGEAEPVIPTPPIARASSASSKLTALIRRSGAEGEDRPDLAR